MIRIAAQLTNQQNDHQITVQTNNNQQSLTIPPKATGFGSSANGGELLFLALATCYCNDLYREAAKRNIAVRSVQVEVSGEFGDAPGSVAENITYTATVQAQASEEDIRALMQHTDTVAEIQNTLRLGTTVTLTDIKAISVT
jgi:uncharacterized OsmC-like protein